jgi:nucleoside-diphosphate-sugar epimerase
MDRGMRQRVLVTGGTGFTGSHLAKRLLARGHDVVVVDNQKGFFHDELERLGARVVLGSVTDERLMDEVTRERDVVHHIAAAFRKINEPKSVYWDVNVNGTRCLLEAAVRNGVEKFVHCSTCGVHGNVATLPAGEDAPIAPADYYQYTKYEGERVVQEFAQRGLNTTILRPAAIYGPGDPGRWLMLFKQVAPGRFMMFGNGRVVYHPLYIDNLIDAFELAVEKEAAAGQAYLIADERYYTLNELVFTIGGVLGKKVSIIYLPFAPLWLAALACEGVCAPLKLAPPLFRRRVDWFRQNRAFDISKAKRELGYDPRVDLYTGLVTTARWYKEHGYL